MLLKRKLMQTTVKHAGLTKQESLMDQVGCA